MESIVEALKSKHRLLVGEGVSNRSINDAETALDVHFCDDYREYLLKFGIGAYNGHELTGISKSERTNVVAVTLSQRTKNPRIPMNMYVIEETNVEEVVIWQSEDGKIYYSSPNYPLTELCSSLFEYILK